MLNAAENRRSIVLMLAAMSLFVINDVFVKLTCEIHAAGQTFALIACCAVVTGFSGGQLCTMHRLRMRPASGPKLMRKSAA